LNKKGIVLSIKSEKCKVQVDNMKMLVSTFNIEKIDKPYEITKNIIKKKNTISKELINRDNLFLTKMKTFKNNIFLRQFRVEEARLRLEKYLDDAYLLGVSPVYVIHGRGKGVLREEVKKLLDRAPNIKSFRSGDASEGGMGVTVVYFKN
jgi:DNA mismatch repair protein MutS2